MTETDIGTSKRFEANEVEVDDHRDQCTQEPSERDEDDRQYADDAHDNWRRFDR
jgi:hypothetical protein